MWCRFGSIRRSGSKFAAVVRRGDKQHHLGSFVTKADGLRALDKFLIYNVRDAYYALVPASIPVCG